MLVTDSAEIAVDVWSMLISFVVVSRHNVTDYKKIDSDCLMWPPDVVRVSRWSHSSRALHKYHDAEANWEKKLKICGLTSKDQVKILTELNFKKSNYLAYGINFTESFLILFPPWKSVLVSFKVPIIHELEFTLRGDSQAHGPPPPESATVANRLGLIGVYYSTFRMQIILSVQLMFGRSMTWSFCGAVINFYMSLISFEKICWTNKLANRFIRHSE